MKFLAELNPQFVVFLLGTILLASGTWWIYPPAGLIVGGAVLVGDVMVGRVIALKLAQKRERDS